MPGSHPASLYTKMLDFLRLIGLLICISHTSTLLAIEDDDDALKLQTTKSAASSEDNDTLSLPDNSLQLAGIKTQILQRVQRPSEWLTHGSVLSLEPLLALRQQYLSASALQDGALAKYQESASNLTRTRDLHSQDIVSTRRLQEQQALWQSEKANLANSRYQQQAILASSTLQWGQTLTEWFVRGHGANTERFIQNQAQLLLITLPADLPVNSVIHVAFIDERGRREHAHQVEAIARAPQVDPVTQGARHFFKREGRPLPIGSHLTVWVATEDDMQTGVILPNSAILWHLGQACVFVKSDATHFVRRILQDFTPSDGGYFVKNGLQPGDEIVVTGAQTLLSQTLKHQIPSEDDD